jgi:hypothetical protein
MMQAQAGASGAGNDVLQQFPGQTNFNPASSMNSPVPALIRKMRVFVITLFITDEFVQFQYSHLSVLTWDQSAFFFVLTRKEVVCEPRTFPM